MSQDTPVFVAREKDVAALNDAWQQAAAGTARFIRLQAPFGGGRRALSSEFLRGVQSSNDDAIIWRVNCLDQENGLQWLVRMYGSLVATLGADILRRGKVEMVLNAQLPGQPKRVQNWYQQFIASLKEAKTDRQKGEVKLRMPQDNPLIGLVEIVAAISRKIPLILELQNAYSVNSMALAMFVEALHLESRESGATLMVVLFDEPSNEVSESLHPMPLLDYYERGGAEALAIAPWGEAETQKFLTSKGMTANAAQIAQISKGRPGFIAELVEILEEDGKLGDDLADVSFGSLVPFDVDEEELEVPSAPPEDGQRKHAGPDDCVRVAFLAALLGQAFPSNLVADMGGFDRESIDDLFDAMGDLFEEVQFSKELGTWIYRFKRGAWREGVLEQNADEESQEVARRVGMFMERFLVPRGYGFIVKTARVYAEHGAPDRAKMIRAMALSNDGPDVWGLAYDFSTYFDEIHWPDTMRRTVYMNLLERLVNANNVQAAEKIHSDVTEWATEREDRDMLAWLLYLGSRLDARRNDLYRARDRARDAAKLYEALDNKIKVAEIENHMAMLELQDGNPTAALEHTNAAIEKGKSETGEEGEFSIAPGILASSEHIRGLVARRSGNVKQASEHFKKANEIAGQAGLGQLALDAGLSFGESLLASGQTTPARDVLGRVLVIAQQLRNPARERTACELLAQAEGALKNFDRALPLAKRVLQLSQQLKLTNAMPIDLYNLGFFHFVTKQPTEALAFFRQAEQGADGLGQHPVVKELYYFKGLAELQTGNREAAKVSLRTGIPYAEKAQDWRKLCSSLENLAAIEQADGDIPAAKESLAQAIEYAKKANLKDERKGLQKKLNAL